MAKAKALSKAALSLLSRIVGETIKGNFLHTSEKEHKPLLAFGDPAVQLVEVNGAIKDANGNVATRATAAGIAMVQAAAPVTAPVAAPAGKPTFNIVVGVPRPAGKKRGGGGNTYPFEGLVAPVAGANGSVIEASFFVPATAERPNPAKAMGSTVSSANRRYKDQTPARKFAARPMTDGAPWGHAGVPGAAIYRIL